jgi:cysteine sulfinate desulfinase/cysteine desulfurase-like protein
MPFLPAVWEAMRPEFSNTYVNPASAHWAGRRARQALEDARECTASLLGADPAEVVFTSQIALALSRVRHNLCGQRIDQFDNPKKSGKSS